ncbi:MAG: hypothetical protein WC621_02585 [Patescibacteria group bacterium]
MQIYRTILRRAWQILWQHAWLWPLGLFAALAGNGGEYSALAISSERVATQISAWQTLQTNLKTDQVNFVWEGIKNTFSHSPVLVIWLLFVLIVVAILVLWIIIVSQASLIQATGKIDAGESTNFTKTTSAAVKHFWPIFFLNLLAKFFIYLLLAVAFLPFLIALLIHPQTNWNFNLLVIISFIISAPLSLIISFVLKYAAIYIVLAKEKWWSALAKAINLFFRNWLVSLEMAAILFVINFALSMVVFLLIPNTILLEVYVLFTGFNWITLFRVLPTFILFVAAGTWFATFQYVAWTLLYRRLEGDGIIPKLIRLTEHLPPTINYWLNKNPLDLGKK